MVIRNEQKQKGDGETGFPDEEILKPLGLKPNLLALTGVLGEAPAESLKNAPGFVKNETKEREWFPDRREWEGPATFAHFAW